MDKSCALLRACWDWFPRWTICLYILTHTHIVRSIHEGIICYIFYPYPISSWSSYKHTQTHKEALFWNVFKCAWIKWTGKWYEIQNNEKRENNWQTFCISHLLTCLSNSKSIANIVRTLGFVYNSFSICLAMSLLLLHSSWLSFHQHRQTTTSLALPLTSKTIYEKVA